MRKHIAPYLGLFLAMFHFLPHAQGQVQDLQGTMTEIKPPFLKELSYTIVPLLFYTPETQLGLGLGAQASFLTGGSRRGTRKSSAFLAATYSTQKQLVINLTPQVYFSNERYFVDGYFQFSIFPNKFWGIGNDMPETNLERYSSQNIDFRLTFLRRLPPHINFGFRYFFYNQVMLETDSTGQIAEGVIPGTQGGTQSGLGIITTVDTRNSIQQPYKGRYYEFLAEFASRTLGSSYTYASISFDFRNYFSLSETQCLAMQIFLQANSGTVPFQRMAQLGGGIRTRGYFRGRYMDLSMYAVQLEYRWKFLPRWHMAAFASTGDVAPLLGSFTLSKTKPSVGGGLRFKVRKEDDTVIRIDFGYGFIRNSTGVYFGVNEAF